LCKLHTSIRLEILSSIYKDTNINRYRSLRRPANIRSESARRSTTPTTLISSTTPTPRRRTRTRKWKRTRIKAAASPVVQCGFDGA